MYTIIIIMIVGIALGFLVRQQTKWTAALNPIITYAIYALLFLLGVSVGTNRQILQHLDDISLQALLLTIGGIGGSVITAYFTYIAFFKNEK